MDQTEAMCYCKDEEAVCGSDGKSYDNVCQLKLSASVAGKSVTVEKQGPCHSGEIEAL